MSRGTPGRGKSGGGKSGAGRSGGGRSGGGRSSGGKSPKPARGDPGLRVRVRTAKGRPLASTRWLERQLNDPYVAAAKREGYRSRAAYKLIELDDRFHLLKPGLRVVDLGAAPGGWTQVAAVRVNAAGRRPGPRGSVVAIDVAEMAPVEGATVLELDFLDETAPRRLKEALGGPLAAGAAESGGLARAGLADLVLSDMAAPATGHPPTDHLRIVALCEAAAAFAREVLAPGGAFLAKVLRGGTERALLESLKRDFAQVRHAKPPASRADSAEIYVVATGFRGRG